MPTLLIANRGEIARRVTRTARALGHRVVVVHTDADAGAQHVREADQAVRVPSYLDVDAVVAAAVEAGADVVHPGYGFLSERAAFARALAEAGVALAGPSAEVMDAMGRKDAARDLAVEAGVPVVPQGHPEDASGFPVLVKAAAGGGGKGMRVVREPGAYDEAVAAARREALSGFGDDTLLVERYVEHGRHIEVQVFGDAHGHVVHLGDRECSAQRRHQKVLEEAPAPRLPDEVRRTVRDGAVALARHVGYTGAGTVEFLLDETTAEVFFLEMNTRLQVEHPVTEEVVRVRGERIDLVALQLAVAAGEPLGFDQDDVTLEGHAMEVRVYAEDPYAGFLPQAGRAGVVRWPDGEGVRVDEALETGQVVGTGFDPMLGKVVAVGGGDDAREVARRRLVDALDRTVVLGLRTNTGFLRWLADGHEVRDARVETAWLDRVELDPPDDSLARVVAAWADATAVAAEPAGPFTADGWRLGADPDPLLVDLEGDPRVRLEAGGRSGEVDGVRVRELDREALADGLLRLRLGLDGRTLMAYAHLGRHAVEVVVEGQRHAVARPEAFGEAGAPVGDGSLVSPMPGTVLDVRVAEGDEVGAGQTLAVVEAMKMEIALSAPFDGRVAAVGAAEGDRVAMGQLVVEVEQA